jgi:hypothetical protein
MKAWFSKFFGNRHRPGSENMSSAASAPVLGAEPSPEPLAMSKDDALARLEDLQHTQDNDILASVARKDVDSRVRLKAVELISSQTHLVGLLHGSPDIYEDRDPQVCSAAICGLKDQADLFQVVRKVTDNQVAVCAVEKITGQGILQSIAGGSFPEAVQCAAMDRVQDPVAVNQLALTAPTVSVRTRAIQRLDTRYELTHIANHEANEYLRQLAIDRLWRLFSSKCQQCLGTGRRVILGDGPGHRPLCGKELCSFCHGSGRFLAPF